MSEELSLSNAEVVPILKKYHNGGIFNFMGFTEEILAIAKPIIERQERERIREQILDMYDGALPEPYNEAIRRIWQALKGGKNDDNKDSS